MSPISSNSAIGPAVLPPSPNNVMMDAGQLNTAFSQAQNAQQALARTGQINQALARTLPAQQAASAALQLAQAQSATATAYQNLNSALATRNPALIVLASAQATASTTALVQRQNQLVVAMRAADTTYAAENPRYAKFSQRVNNSKIVQRVTAFETGPTMGKVLRVVSGVGAGAGIVVGGFMLPKLVSSIGTSYQQLKTDLNNPATARGTRIDDAVSFARSNVMTVETVEGMKAGAQTLVMLGQTSARFGGLVTALTNNGLVRHTFGALGGVLDKILPFADAGMLGVDSYTAYKTFKDPKATTEAKIRAGVNVGLDGLKVLTHFLPFSMPVLFAYMAASLAQLGLVAFDLWGSAKAKWQSMNAPGAPRTGWSTMVASTVHAFQGFIHDPVTSLKTAFSRIGDFLHTSWTFASQIFHGGSGSSQPAAAPVPATPPTPAGGGGAAVPVWSSRGVLGYA